MARSASSQPTDVELQILRTLWQSNGATAREVHNALADVEKKDTAYSTTVKMLLVMLEKGLVKRDDDASPQIYTAASSQKATQRRMLGNLIDKVYNGSALSLVMHALSTSKASKEDRPMVRQLLQELEDQK